MKTSEVEGVLRVLRVLRVLGVMQAANVHTDTLKAKRLLTRRSQASQILGQQFELRHRHGAVRWSRGWRGSAPGVATHSDPNRRGKHALWNYRIRRLIDPLPTPATLIGNDPPFSVTIATLIPVNYSPVGLRLYVQRTIHKLPVVSAEIMVHIRRFLCVENSYVEGSTVDQSESNNDCLAVSRKLWHSEEKISKLPSR